MASATSHIDIPRLGQPAMKTRFFGWAMLGILVAFLINNVLNVGFGLPGAMAVFSGDMAGIVPLLVYVASIVASWLYVARSTDTALRWDARQIHRMNIFIIRACFWAVLFVGVADAIIAFMRIENLFDYFITEDSARAFGKSRVVGSYVHIPLVVLGIIFACFTRTLGFTWLALLIVIAELLIVITRFVFSYEQAFMGDLVRYWYAALFLFASAYTLFDEGHVRVDVLYAGFKNKTRGFVNAIGSLLLGASTCWVILAIGMNGKQSMINSPIMNFEITQTGGTGLFVKYQMAAFLAIFAITMLIQFVSYFLEAVADYRGEPGHIDHEPAAH